MTLRNERYVLQDVDGVWSAHWRNNNLGCQLAHKVLHIKQSPGLWF